MKRLSQQLNDQYASFAGLPTLPVTHVISGRAIAAAWPAHERIGVCSILNAAGGASVSH